VRLKGETRMKLLAISDMYIPPGFMRDGLAQLRDIGIDVEVRSWEHKTLIDLQEDNLAIEAGGPDAVELSDEITDNLERFEILVVQFLQAFGSNVIASDPYFKGDAAPAKLVTLDTLMKTSDVVSIHARLTEESYHLIGEKELAMMKPNAVLLNTARSGLVDEQAPIEVLRTAKITGAALDVFDEEPLPADHPFIQLENVTITAHLAGSTIDAFKNSVALMAGHIRNTVNKCDDIPVINNIRPCLEIA